MNHPHTPTRRTFVRALAATGLAAPAVWPALARAASANGKLRHAVIGVDGMQGGADLGNFLRHPKLEPAVFCDVDKTHLAKAAEKAPSAAQATDWREVIADAGDIDSVSITVPDHMHAPIAMAAMKAGKHVYCQKPLCHRVTQVRAITEQAARSGVVTQLGTQIASSVGNRLGIRLIRDGAIGKVKRVVLNSNGRGDRYRPAASDPVPANLDWDRWLGVAPERPYAASVYHPMIWRGWQDFGTGWLGDMGCHIFHVPWAALGLTAPRRVRAEVQASWAADSARRRDTWPQAQHISWVFAGNEHTAGDELMVDWYDGAMAVPDEFQTLNETPRYPKQASMVIGTEGVMVLPHTRTPLLFPSAKFKGFKYPKLPPRNHYHHFVDACLGGASTESGFAATGPMNEAILLGATVAARLPGRWLEWDAKAMRVTNAPEASGFLKETYRKGWSVAGLG